MSEPDEALLWAREQLATFWEKAPGVRAADRAAHINNARSGASDGDLEDAVTGRLHWLDGNRAGAAASAERIKELEARVAAFEWALTPSGDTKFAYIGEFKQAVEDENVIIIEWTVVKEIMEAIRKFALLKDPDQ